MARTKIENKSPKPEPDSEPESESESEREVSVTPSSPSSGTVSRNDAVSETKEEEEKEERQVEEVKQKGKVYVLKGDPRSSLLVFRRKDVVPDPEWRWEINALSDGGVKKASKIEKNVKKNSESNSKIENKKRMSKSKLKSDAKKKKPEPKPEPEPESVVVPTSSTESGNNVVSEGEGEEEEEAKKPKKNEKNVQKSNNSKEKKKKGIKVEEEEGEGEEKSESRLYKFPMAQVTRIIKSEDADTRISQEAVFVINKAAEKFLELFAKEAYACAFLDKKSYVGYQHLSSVVTKRRRFDFLSDFLPEKVKAEDALAEQSKNET